MRTRFWLRTRHAGEAATPAAIDVLPARFAGFHEPQAHSRY